MEMFKGLCLGQVINLANLYKKASKRAKISNKTCELTLLLLLKNSLIIHEENTKKNHKRVVSVYVIQIHVDLHKLKL
jgi:hypothetical protein